MACSHQEEQAYQTVIEDQLRAYPASRLQDIYKYFYQSHFGAGHMIGDTAATREYLHREITEMPDSSSLPLCQSLLPEGNYIRVDLRCVDEGKISEEALAQAFIASARPPEDEKMSWEKEWQLILAAIRRTPLAPEGWEEDEPELTQAAKHHAAVHHSDSYRQAYHPHYRLVSREALGELMLDILNEQKISLLVFHHDTLTTYIQHGVRDLLYLYQHHPELLEGSVVADKKIGTAAATLLALGKVKEAHTNYITDQGKQILDEAGIRYYARSEGPMIYQQDGVSRCPVDKGTSELQTAEERVQFISHFYHAQGEALLRIVNADHLSLIVFQNDSIYRYNSRGVQDLLTILEEEPERLKGAIVADKVIGKAAASLMIAGKVKGVYTNLICTPARELFEAAKIPVYAIEEVPQILNRDRSGQCPIDSRLNEAQSVEECVRILSSMNNE